MPFVYNDPYGLRGGVEQLAGQQPIGTRRERDRPIPVDALDAVEGKGDRDAGVKSNRRKGRSK